MVARKYYEMKGAQTESGWCANVYMGARVPELYQEPIALEPFDNVKKTVQGNPRFI
jgi:hypothetical protein